MLMVSPFLPLSQKIKTKQFWNLSLFWTSSRQSFLFHFWTLILFSNLHKIKCIDFKYTHQCILTMYAPTPSKYRTFFFTLEKIFKPLSSPIPPPKVTIIFLFITIDSRTLCKWICFHFHIFKTYFATWQGVVHVFLFLSFLWNHL